MKKFRAITRDSNLTILTDVMCSSLISAKRVCTRDSVGMTARQEVWEYHRGEWIRILSKRHGCGEGWSYPPIFILK